jgi:tetratricopeptide (TPR) repeat protein
MADYQLHGLRAGGYHLTNVLLHTASVILLFLILRQMTGALCRSAFVAAVFAIHPLRVESVAWVAERKDVLAAFFFMLTLGAYIRFVQKPNSLIRYLLVAVAFVLALLSKPTVVTLPFVLLLLDYWPLNRFGKQGVVHQKEYFGIPQKLILEKIPLLALAAGACVMTVLTARNWITPAAEVSMPSRVGHALISYAVYLRQMVWPEGLAAFYPPPEKGYPPLAAVFSFLLLALISWGVLVCQRNRRWLLVGWLWYLGVLAPMSGLVQAGTFAHADRNTYLPQIGIYLAVTWLTAEWGAQWHASRATLGSLMAGVLALLMVCAWNQTAYWQNSETLWIHTLACTTDNALAHQNLGIALFEKGRVDEAISHYREALEIEPNYGKAHYNLGNALLQKGNVAEALVHYQEAVEVDPENAEAHYNLGASLEQTGKMDEAITQFQQALQINPGYAEACNNLGQALCQTGRVDEGITQFQQALEINPAFVKAHNNLGIALFEKGRADEAISQYEKALQLGPANPEVQNNLAWLLATCPQASLRNGNKAVELAQQANELVGGENPVILHTLAAAYAEAGQFSEALETARRALQLAWAQANAKLAGQLQVEMKLYQAGNPFHLDPAGNSPK